MGYSIKDILHNNAKRLLHIETEPGLGCTEPAAVGLCAAAAAAMLESKEFSSITVETDPNIYKNAMGVIIPNSGSACGIPLASAMGAAAGDPSLMLQVFATVSPEGLAKANALLAANVVTARIAEGVMGLYVKTTITAGGHTAEVLITGSHDNIVSRALDGKPIPNPGGGCGCGAANGTAQADLMQWLLGMSLDELVDLLDDLDSDDLGYIRKGLELNTALVEYGLSHGPGIGVGRTQLSLIRQGLLKKDAVVWAGMRAAAGIDSRMGGVSLPAMTLAGSGNQGIAAGMPVAAVAQFAVLEDESLVLKAVTLSYLVTCLIKATTGRLSALCGSGIAGGAGVAAGTAYLLGGTVETIGGAIKNHLENYTAVICDGAKTSCALKVGEMVASGVKSAMLAIHGCVVRPIDGFIDQSAEQTIRNLGKIAQNGMSTMDPAILEIMLTKRL
jgi:L-cysteine desulfidase